MLQLGEEASADEPTHPFPVLSRTEFNGVLIITTIACVICAVLALIWLVVFDKIRHTFRRKKTPQRAPTPPVTVTVSPSDKNQVSVKIGDEMEFIDDRNTNIVSSTVQIKSIHDSPTPANL